MGSVPVKFHDDRCRGEAVMRRKPFSVIYALWPWPLDLKIYRAHPWLMGSLHVKFHDDRCKGKAVMHRKPFSVIYALWPWPLDLKIYRAHPWLMGSLHVKFHDDRCKGKAVMRRKLFSVIYALWPWPFDLKIYLNSLLYRIFPYLFWEFEHRHSTYLVTNKLQVSFQTCWKFTIYCKILC